MARITVEDCLRRVSNRFELAVLASRRAKQILRGAPTMLGERYRNRPIVMSLREIAAGHVWPQYSGADVSGSGAAGKDKVAAPRDPA